MLLPISWSFVISSPCTVLCYPIPSVSHFSWSPFVRQTPIMKRRCITGWVLRSAPLAVCSTRKCETPLWNVYIKPHTPSATFWASPEQLMKGEAFVQLLRMLRPNAAPWWQTGPVQRLCRAASALLSLSSHSLWLLAVKSTADLGQILHSEVAFKGCSFYLENRWSPI